MAAACSEGSTVLLARGVRVPAQGQTSRPPLRGPVELALRAGQRLRLDGPSGSGKTTLLRCLSLLEPRMQGELRFRGAAIADHDVPAYRRSVCYVPQTPPRLAGDVERSLAAVFAFSTLAGRSFDRECTLGLCRGLRLSDEILRRDVVQLSGGEARRLALVRALLVQPQVLLLDEPTAGLDDAACEAMAQVLREFLQGDEGRALLLVTHIPDAVAALATELRRFAPDGSLGAPEVVP